MRRRPKKQNKQSYYQKYTINIRYKQYKIHLEWNSDEIVKFGPWHAQFYRGWSPLSTTGYVEKKKEVTRNPRTMKSKSSNTSTTRKKSTITSQNYVLNINPFKYTRNHTLIIVRKTPAEKIQNRWSDKIKASLPNSNNANAKTVTQTIKNSI